MGIVSIRIPQIGEGLQEARVVAFLKQPGESIKRDEPIYQMETDKAVMDVESPVDGVLIKWLVEADDVVSIGAEIASVETDATVEAASENPTETAPAAEVPAAKAVIPPRTRAYASEKGLSDADLNKLAASGEKLMPADIDAFLASGGTGSKKASGREYTDSPVSSKQRILNSRLQRGGQLVVPGTITVAVDWEAVDREKARLRKVGDGFNPSAFTLFAFGVAQAVKSHPKLRTSLVGDDMFRTYQSLSLGIAVALPEDELALAVVENADNLSWREFATKLREGIDKAREGNDQAHEAVTLSLTNMQSFGLRDAVPVVVPPAAATLFLGECYLSAHEEETEVVTRKTCNLALTFDHRIMNGVGAAQFMAAVRENVQHIERQLLANENR